MTYLTIWLASSLPMGALIFAGSFFGVWRKSNTKPPWTEVVLIFIGAWLLAAVLMIVFHILFIGQDHETRQVVGSLWGPLIVGVAIGRKATIWRCNRYSSSNHKKVQSAQNAQEDI